MSKKYPITIHLSDSERRMLIGLLRTILVNDHSIMRLSDMVARALEGARP